MKLTLAPGVTAAAFDAALRAFAAVVGQAWVLSTDEDRGTYMDAYAVGDGGGHVPSAAVAPQSVQEVQAILRIANEHKIPLWPVSRGKNLGYGEAAPLLSGSVVLDLGRMNRILDIDAKTGTALLEPGVSFFDLYGTLQQQKIPLWLSVPGNAWGSVIGNALERGLGYTPYGDHTSKLCGLEVVLPSGDLVRTGMGAMANGKTWQNYQHGFGPGWDQMFVQSNFGVVTKGGLWLMPEPEATLRVTIDLPRPDDIGWFIDEMTQLRLRGVIEQPFVCGNYLRQATVFSEREDWYRGPGAIPDEVGAQIRDHFKTGWWSATFAVFGYAEVVQANANIIRRAIEPRLGHRLKFESWKRGEPIERSGAGVPNLLSLQIVNWRGGRGGHVGFSPVMPPDGKLALAQFRKMKARFDQFGFDYYGSFTIGQRHINNVNLIIYDRDDAAMTAAARKLFATMIDDAARDGYGEYRTHLSFMQDVADSFDFNNHALARLNATVKHALDPNGILAPGKNGIWAKA
jgi:4-cresol dehydrogenase (hydroxylating)